MPAAAAIAAALLPTAAAGQAQRPNDWVVVPGVRVGPIGKHTSVEALKSLFSGAQITHDRDRRGHKTLIRLSAAGSGGRNADLLVRWRNNWRHRRVLEITVFSRNNQWRTASGITMGAPMETVQIANDKRFPLTRTGRLYYTDSWAGGKISRYLGIGFAQRPPKDDMSKLPVAIHSEHPVVKGKSFRVIGFVVKFP